MANKDGIVEVEKPAAPVEAADNPAEGNEQNSATSMTDAENSAEAAEAIQHNDAPAAKRHKRDVPERRQGQRPGYYRTRNYNTENRKYRSQYEELPETDDPTKIRDQVEYYFGEANLPYDLHLLEKVGGSKNYFIPISYIANFKRMQRFKPMSAIVNALKESTELEVNDKNEVRRKKPLDGPNASSNDKSNDNDAMNLARIYDDKAQPRSIYAKGFGDEANARQLELEKFFKPYGAISVRMRRVFDTKDFKGSVFVEFSTEDEAKQFLDQDEKPKWKGNDLLIMSKKTYVEGKNKDIAAGKIEPNIWRGGSLNKRSGGRRTHRDYRRRSRTRSRSPYEGRHDRDRDDWNGRRRDFQRSDGFRSRSRGRGRGRGRDRRDDRRDDKRGHDDNEIDLREYDEDGVPVIKKTPSKKPVADMAVDGVVAEQPSSPSKKRARDVDDDPGNEVEAKKTKIEAAA